MYSDWTKDELISEINRLKRRIEDLEEKNNKQYMENSHLQFVIDTELEPRIKSEKRAYDNWVTNPER